MKVLEDCVTNKSLVLIDELFKHTTFDEGLALALAFLENLAELKACFYRYFYNIWTLYFIFKADFVNFIFPIFQAFTFVATHYHDLCLLSNVVPNIGKYVIN